MSKNTCFQWKSIYSPIAKKHERLGSFPSSRSQGRFPFSIVRCTYWEEARLCLKRRQRHSRCWRTDSPRSAVSRQPELECSWCLCRKRSQSQAGVDNNGEFHLRRVCLHVSQRPSPGFTSPSYCPSCFSVKWAHCHGRRHRHLHAHSAYGDPWWLCGLALHDLCSQDRSRQAPPAFLQETACWCPCLRGTGICGDGSVMGQALDLVLILPLTLSPCDLGWATPFWLLFAICHLSYLGALVITKQKCAASIRQYS